MSELPGMIDQSTGERWVDYKRAAASLGQGVQEWAPQVLGEARLLKTLFVNSTRQYVAEWAWVVMLTLYGNTALPRERCVRVLQVLGDDPALAAAAASAARLGGDPSLLAVGADASMPDRPDAWR